MKDIAALAGSPHYPRPRVVLVGLMSAACLWAAGLGAAEVLTNSYDEARTGANLQERILHPANVRPATFGRLYSYPVDGPVFAQPLIATSVQIPRVGKRDVLYTATAANSVFAFDARESGAGPLWHRPLLSLPGGVLAEPRGILGTPVIDRTTQTIYLVAGFLQGDRGRFLLHALDLRDGTDRPGSPVEIAGSVTVDGTTVHFTPTVSRVAVQRAGLALAQGHLVIAFGGDYFEGWVFSYNTLRLEDKPAAYCTTCASRIAAISHVDYLDPSCTYLGPGGGIWQAGRAPVVDARGLVYFFTGNKAHIVRGGCLIPQGSNACAVCTTPGGCPCEGGRSQKLCRGPDTCTANESHDARVFDTNESLIQLDPGHGLVLRGWWRPVNWNADGPEGLEKNDLDLGGSGPLLIPGTRRLVGGGKQGVVYLLDVDGADPRCVPSLRERCLPAAAENPLQSFAIAPPPPEPQTYYRHLLGGPVLLRPAQGRGPAWVYLWRENDNLRGYAVTERFEGCDGGHPGATASHDCPAEARSADFIDHHPGGILALSANDGDPASAVLWAYTHHIGGGPGRLMAFGAVPDAGAPGQLVRIWDSDLCAGDQIESGADFAQPTVANGRVYLATAAGRVDVFGVLPSRDCAARPAASGPGPLLQ